MTFFHRFNKNVLIPALFFSLFFLRSYKNKKNFICWENFCLVIGEHIDYIQQVQFCSSFKPEEKQTIPETFMVRNKIIPVLSSYSLKNFPLSNEQIEILIEIFDRSNILINFILEDYEQGKIKKADYLEKLKDYTFMLDDELNKEEIQKDIKDNVLKNNDKINSNFKWSLYGAYIFFSIVLNFV